MPLLLFTNILYPYPSKDNNPGEKSAIALHFLNAFDIMDLVEDVEFIQTYSTAWIVLFYVALAGSSFLLAFPVGLEDDDENDPHKYRVLSSIGTLIFTDISFSVIRLCVISKQGNYQIGFNFLMKNMLAGISRLVLIIKRFRN